MDCMDGAAQSAPKSKFIEAVPVKPQSVPSQFFVTLPNGVRIECRGDLSGGALSSLVNAVSQIE
ncbi:MAG: hypothetical protein AAFN07_15295 [Pseudomonadota bacterium]